MKFELNNMVVIICSGESGMIISRSEHTHAEPNYQVRYKCADGRAVEAWWMEESLMLKQEKRPDV